MGRRSCRSTLPFKHICDQVQSDSFSYAVFSLPFCQSYIFISTLIFVTHLSLVILFIKASRRSKVKPVLIGMDSSDVCSGGAARWRLTQPDPDSFITKGKFRPKHTAIPSPCHLRSPVLLQPSQGVSVFLNFAAQPSFFIRLFASFFHPPRIYSPWQWPSADLTGADHYLGEC